MSLAPSRAVNSRMDGYRFCPLALFKYVPTSKNVQMPALLLPIYFPKRNIRSLCMNDCSEEESRGKFRIEECHCHDGPSSVVFFDFFIQRSPLVSLALFALFVELFTYEDDLSSLKWILRTKWMLGRSRNSFSPIEREEFSTFSTHIFRLHLYPPFLYIFFLFNSSVVSLLSRQRLQTQY